jgi:hypothetical protein
MLTTSRTWRVVACLAALTMLTAACSDDDDSGDSTTTSADDATTTTGDDGGPAPDAVTITGSDYKYEGVPEELSAGQELVFVNDSTIEVHELVALKLPDGETRDIEELVALQQDELDLLFGSGPPAAVLIALPGEDAINALGDGTLTVPGRYALICAIPLGADVEAYREFLAGPPSEEPPDIPGGPPHFSQGMYAQTTVS